MRGLALAVAVAEASNASGFDLLAELDDGDNVVISPTSIAVALTMILNGAAGSAEEAIANSLWTDAGTPFEAHARCGV